jgi:hypothetical protein
MIWVIIIAVIIGIILFRFFSDLNKDNFDIENQNLSEKFSIIVSILNESAFAGYGTVTILDKRSFNLYENGKNQIVSFYYSTGHLTITWKYKYFQKEIVHEHQFNDVRNLSIFEQQNIAKQMIAEMNLIIDKHKKDVISFI